MIPIPSNISADDVGQWLYGGICLVLQEDRWTPAIADRITTSDDESELMVRCRTVLDRFGATHRVRLDRIRAHWPLCGSINLPDLAMSVHVERSPAKQYKRTFNPRQVVFTVPRAWDVRKKRGAELFTRATTIGPETCIALFKPWYPESYEHALAKLSDGWISVAINPRVSVAGDEVGKRMIYYRGKLAATINGDIIAPVADPLTCELIDRATGGRYTWIAL